MLKIILLVGKLALVISGSILLVAMIMLNASPVHNGFLAFTIMCSFLAVVASLIVVVVSKVFSR